MSRVVALFASSDIPSGTRTKIQITVPPGATLWGVETVDVTGTPAITGCEISVADNVTNGWQIELATGTLLSNVSLQEKIYWTGRLPLPNVLNMVVVFAYRQDSGNPTKVTATVIAEVP